MSLSRRSILKSSPAAGALVIGGVTGQLATCTSSGITIAPGVIDAIQAAVAEGCSFVPAAQTIVALAAQFPAISNVATIAGAVLTQISDLLCTSYIATASKGLPELKATPPMAGTVPIHGLHVVNGVFVSF